MRLKGKTAVITGAATGIGRATAVLFAKEGANVVLNTAHNIEAAESTVSEIQLNHGSCTFAMGDVSIQQDVQRIIHKTINQFGQLDVLVNNAAIGVIKPLGETSEEEWDQVLGVNLKGVFLMCKHALHYMVERHSGSIVNVSSAWGLVAGYNAAAYCTSKAGLINLTRSVALDYGKHGIRANVVCPGSIDTPILRQGLAKSIDPDAEEKALIEAHPIGRIGDPLEVAYTILWLASEEASFVTGAPLIVDGGLTAKCSQEGSDRWPPRNIP